MRVEFDLRTLDLQLNNGFITTPASLRMDFSGVDLLVYVPNPDGEAMDAHQISIDLARSQVRLIIRSPLGSKPEVRTLYDFREAEDGA